MADDPSMRGRVMALYMTVFMGGTPFGAPLLGWIAEHAGARWTLIGGGAMTVVGIFVAVVMSARRQGLVITRYIRSAWTPSDQEIGPVVTD
jgi:MFS family permease